LIQDWNFDSIKELYLKQTFSKIVRYLDANPTFSAPSIKLALMSVIVDIFPATKGEVLVLSIPNMV